MFNLCNANVKNLGNMWKINLFPHHRRTQRFAVADDLLEVAFGVHIKHDDGRVVFAAEGEGGQPIRPGGFQFL